MEEIMRVDENAISSARIKHKNSLSRKYEFYSTLMMRDIDSIGRLSKDAYDSAISLEDFLSTFSAVRECTEKYLAARGLSSSVPKSDFSSFLNIFSTYAGISEGRLSLNLPEECTHKSGINFIDFRENSGNPESYLDIVVSSYLDSVKKNTKSGSEMKKLLSVLYNSLEEKIMGEKESYKILAAAVSEVVLSIDGIKLRGFSAHNGIPEKKEEEQLDYEQKITFDKIIGNKKAKEALKRYADMLFLYNPAEKKNPVSEFTYIPRTVFMYAGPGTGKTSLASAGKNYMKELSEKTGKKFSWVTIDSSIKKKWYGETEEILKAKTDSAMSPEGIGVIFIDDIDGLVASRNDFSANAPDKSMTMYLMQLVEGIDTPYFGNYMIISASNRPDDLDPALIERISESSFLVPGPETTAEYVDFLKIKMEKGISAGYVSIKNAEWESAAELCMKHRETLSPRDLTKAIRVLQQESSLGVSLDGIISLPPEMQREKIRISFSPITISVLEDAIISRYKNEIEQHALSEKSLIQRRASEIEREYNAIEMAKERVK
jgi:AAA+ superfamily predicted ATPase